MTKVQELMVRIPLLLVGVHTVSWLVTKGIIYIAMTLFNTNWYGEFWAVYLMMFIFGLYMSSYKRK